MTIVIIEDDPVWQLTLRMVLEQLDDPFIFEFDTIPEAQHFLSHNKAHLVVSDVVLQKQLSFALFQDPARTYPVVFVTGHPDRQYLQQALSLPNSTLLIKPFHQFSLLAAIRTLLNQQQPGQEDQQGLSVTGKYRQEIIIPFSSIVYIQAEGNYSIIQLVGRKHLLKRSLRTIMQQLDSRFVQIQKSFIINTEFLNRIDLSARQANLNGQSIPIGRLYRKSLLKHLDL